VVGVKVEAALVQVVIAAEPTGHAPPDAQRKLPEATPVHGVQPAVVLHASQLLFIEHASHVSLKLPLVHKAAVVL